ncbi:hypothetical protein VE00_06386 [Pseudogymnoascus sp. WSF 3629]|nr:hypothetical protein VE00_06386 [Pseudogymnoascus sp. WSF 3629]
MAFPQHERVFSPNSAETVENSPVETSPRNSAVLTMCLNPQPESSLGLNQDHHPQEEIISNDNIDLSVAAEAAKYPVVTLLQKLAALFRKRERNGSWVRQETDDLIATMIETVLQELAILSDRNHELDHDLSHVKGRIDQFRESNNQIRLENTELNLKIKALESQAIQLRNNAPRVKLVSYQNGQGAAMGQTPGALFNEERTEEKTATLVAVNVAGSELRVNSDETGPPMKRTRFPGHMQ